MTDFKLDIDGYLVEVDHWNKDIAIKLAADMGIELTEAHWEVLGALRGYYQSYEHAPSQRPFVKHITNVLGKDKGNSIYLMSLFPDSPAKVAAKIAGLPRPTNCF